MSNFLLQFKTSNASTSFGAKTFPDVTKATTVVSNSTVPKAITSTCVGEQFQDLREIASLLFVLQ